ncbi:CPBP family intramembrane metalloprotease [Phenylobacterium sp. 20VBR1]|uniref:CPBP family intramembrane metalloprotease n=1 Tax=Phenylobacterium glaciei TaxID=2803784 RepID=A0A941D505_9CAUL|nr:CPBP family intramembrane glutamic endopeptidase [Phenylobacterium glaciei]MBR7621834.1 CPBP family intramembrane metalloprotease [Phenylobacterium glaciei]QQZ50350.1 CPBP family intramembrane metalloprotease [Phenylobacterium glaciei]
MAQAGKPRSPWVFFGLVFLLAIPFYVLGALVEWPLMPGLPIAALAIVCPALAAIILVYRAEAWTGVSTLLRRGVDRVRPPGWLLPILMIMPLVMAASFGIQRLMGAPIPAPQLSLVSGVLYCVLFFVAALCEELGWSGYATDPLVSQFGPLGAGLVLGLVWALYHYVPLAQVHRSIGWVACWSIGTVATRVMIVWLYTHAGRSVLAATLFHMTVNVTWQMFPIHGSFYDPRVTGPLSALAAVLLVAIGGRRWIAGARSGPERP